MKHLYSCAAVFLLTASSLLAQTTLGSILGSITDPTGAAVPGVSIVIRNTGTGIENRATTRDTGLYEVSHLIPGRYAVLAEKPGFKAVNVTNVLLETASAVRVDLRLEVGEVTTSVNVEASAPVINTESADVAGVRSQEVMVKLPINNRNSYYFTMLVLTPGAVRGQGSNVSLGGARGFQWGVTVDGTSQRSPLFANAVGPAESGMEMTAELRIQLANDKAEAALPGGYYATSKSGTNEFHGSLFYYHSNSRLFARNTFSSTVPFNVQNDYGFSGGGPVFKNRTFFYGTYERFPQRQERIFNSNVPTVAFRRGDFSSLLPRTIVRDPANNQPFAGNIIPQARLSQTSQRVQQRFYPLPNFGPENEFQRNWRGVGPGSQFKSLAEGRVDHKLSASNSLFGRYSWNATGANVYDYNLPTMPIRDQDRRTTTITISDTHLFSPSLINEARFGLMISRNPAFNPLDGPALVQEFGLQGIVWNPEIAKGAPIFTLTNFEPIGASDLYQDPSERIGQFVDNVTWTKGKHTLKAGIAFAANRGTNFPGGTSFPVLQFGQFDFPGAYSGFDYSDFLLGIPQTAGRASAIPLQSVVNRDFSWFVQNDWKATRRLTLNFGLRYEYNPPYHDNNELLFNFDPAAGRVIVPSERALKAVNPLFPTNLVPIVTAAQAGLPSSLYFTDLNNFVPRFGFAYRPFGNAYTVIRGGYGIYIDDISSQLWRLGSGGPYVSQESFTNSITNGVPAFQFPRAFPAGFGAVGAQNFTSVNPHFVNPYIQQWSLTLEHEAWGTGFRVSYIGTNSRKLPWVFNVNQPRASTTPFNNNLRPFPQLRNILARENGGIHNYNSLNVVGERKFSKGLHYQLGWTWAHNLTDSQSDSEQGSLPEDAYARHREYENVNYTPRHRLVGSLLYDLPIGRKRAFFSGMNRVTDLVVGGWTISSTLAAQTGSFFSSTFNGFDVSNTNTVGGRPDRIADGNLPTSQRSITRWFDAPAFAVPGDINADLRPDVNVGRFGNSAPSVLVGPGTFDLSAGLHKDFALTERIRATLQGTFRNVLNHPNYGTPATNIRAANVGIITSLNGLAGPRSGQVALRVEF